MPNIDVGNAAINRASSSGTGTTRLDLGNPANATGLITTITVYVASEITTAKIGLFYLTTGTTYVCRSSYTTGVLAVGLNTLSGLSLAVVLGDVIGIYHDTGGIDAAASGGNDAYKIGEYADPGDSASYTTGGTVIYSLYGDGIAYIAPRGYYPHILAH